MENKTGLTAAREKKAFRIYTSIILGILLLFGAGLFAPVFNGNAPETGITASAASAAEENPEGDALKAITNLSDFVFALIRAVGVILVGWGIVQVGLSFQSHDPSQRANGFLTLAGGLVVMFAKSIMNLITGG